MYTAWSNCNETSTSEVGILYGDRAYADAERSPVFGDTPLQRAVIRAVTVGDEDTLRALLDSGTVDVNEPDAEGKTALMYTRQHNEVELCRLLLNAGAAAHVVTQHDITPLMMAAQTGRVQIVAMLIDADAPINTVDDQGRTALGWAEFRSTTSVIPHLERAGAQRSYGLQGYGR
jgi:uncharacterized protein